MAKRRVPAVRRHHPPGPLGFSSCRRLSPPPVGRKFTQELLPPTARGHDLFRPSAAGAPLPAALSATTPSQLRASASAPWYAASAPTSLPHAPLCRLLLLLPPPALPLPSSPASCHPTLPSPPRAQTPPTSCSHHALHARHPSLALLRRCHPLAHTWRGCALAPALAQPSLIPLALRAASPTSSRPYRISLSVTPLHAPVPPQASSIPSLRPAMHPGRVWRCLQVPSPRAQPRHCGPFSSRCTVICPRADLGAKSARPRIWWVGYLVGAAGPHVRPPPRPPSTSLPPPPPSRHTPPPLSSQTPS